MIQEVEVKNFKRFEHLKFRMPDNLVIVGPNNSGKTTFLQTISAWSEISSHWLQKNPDLSREKDRNYPKTLLDINSFSSVPLVSFAHLWQHQNVKAKPLSIYLFLSMLNSEAKTKIGFEILFENDVSICIRPAQDVSENDLEAYKEKPINPIYIPPLSGLEVEEPSYSDEVINPRLAQAKGGTVLRNLLWRVSQNEENWAKLQEVICSYFGYELKRPSSGENVYSRYCHSGRQELYDLSSGASPHFS